MKNIKNHFFRLFRNRNRSKTQVGSRLWNIVLVFWCFLAALDSCEEKHVTGFGGLTVLDRRGTQFPSVGATQSRIQRPDIWGFIRKMNQRMWQDVSNLKPSLSFSLHKKKGQNPCLAMQKKSDGRIPLRSLQARLKNEGSKRPSYWAAS